MFFHCRNRKINYLRKVKSSLPVDVNDKYFGDGRTSVSALCTGSLTLEAAVTIPIFLFAIISALYFIQMTEISIRLTGGLYETGKEMAVYAYLKQADSDGSVNWDGGIVGGLSSVYAKGRVMERSDLANKQGSLNFLYSSILKEDDMIDLVADYRLKFPINALPLPNIHLLERARLRAWTGRDGINGSDSSGGQGELVLITINGEVYHKDPNCSHIKLSIREVSQGSAEGLRNKYGAKYRPCEHCGGGHGSVYITDSGDRYHSSLSCSGLKRGILLVPISEVKDWKPCSRCGQ